MLLATELAMLRLVKYEKELAAAKRKAPHNPSTPTLSIVALTFLIMRTRHFLKSDLALVRKQIGRT